MSDLFEDDDSVVEIDENFSTLDAELDVEPEVNEPIPCSLDARRRLEHMLDEKRLRDELDDFVDY